MSHNLDIFQQVYLQTFAANLTGTVVGPESVLQISLDGLVKVLMSTKLHKYRWEVTWGRRVWKDKEDKILSGPDNAWFASFCKNAEYPDGTTKDTCVIAIAGTATFSKTGWFVEDLAVNKVVDFDGWTEAWKVGSVPKPEGVANEPLGKPYTAYGTSYGVYQLATKTAPAGTPGGGTTIIEYLQTLPEDCRVIFSGHSLGGALSPVLPMCIQNAGLFNKPLENILTLPAAGASPGEKVLSEVYDKYFPPPKDQDGYKTFNANLYNTLDVVSQAWCIEPSVSPKQNIQNILTIYGNLHEPLHIAVKKLIEKEIRSAQSSGVTYYPIRGNAFEGKKPSTPPTELLDFMKEVIFQHTVAFYDLLKVSEHIASLYSTFVGFEGVEKQNLRVASKAYPVIRWTSEDGLLGDDGENIYPYDDIFGVDEDSSVGNY
jgi:hypothetical protein